MVKSSKKPKVIKHREFLTLVGNSKQKKRRNILLKNRIKVNDVQKRKLKRYKNSLRYIAEKGSTIKKKRKLLQQKGGFLTSLLPLAVSAISSIVPSLFGK